MDKETRDFLENMQEGINEFRKETNNRFDSLEVQVKELKTGQEEIKALVGELDPKNANRHIELKDSIDQLRKDLSTVEIVTASNYSDIARLKSVK